MGEESDEVRAQLRRGEALADALVGKMVDEAVAEVQRAGHVAQVLAHEVEVVTADFRFARIRLYVDPYGRVVKATAG